jgi:DNA-binding beta-propeller fold protein YncE
VRFSKVRGCLLVSALAATIGLAAAAPASAANPTPNDIATPLPLPSYADMQVDPGTGQVFLAGGDQIVVVNQDGRLLRTIGGQSGVSGLALSEDGSRVYAALNGANAISVIDTKKMREVQRYAVGSDCPGDLVPAVGKLWFSAACPDTSFGSVGALDLGTGQVTTYVPILRAVFGPPLLAASRDAFGVVRLVAVARDLSSTDLRTYDITSGTLDTHCRDSGGCQETLLGIAQDLAITADGENVVVSSGVYEQEVALWSTAPVDNYPIPEPVAVAVADSGQLAFGSNGSRSADTDVYLFLHGGAVPTWTYDFGGPTLAPRGLAWAAGDSRLYAVVTQSSAFVLHTLVPGA